MKISQHQKAALTKCDLFQLHPLAEPLEDSHHTDVPFTDEDKAIGDALAYFLGTLFADVDESYWHHNRTSVDEWSRVARALRIHGLRISDDRHPRIGARICVPQEPTKEMIAAGTAAVESGIDTTQDSEQSYDVYDACDLANRAYRAMLAAAPKLDTKGES